MQAAALALTPSVTPCGAQGLLHLLSTVLEFAAVYTAPETFFVLANIFGGIVLVILVAFLSHHVRWQPFMYPVRA